MTRTVRLSGRAGTRLRDRMRTVGYRVIEIARPNRSRLPIRPAVIRKHCEGLTRRTLGVALPGFRSSYIPAGPRESLQSSASDIPTFIL